MTIIDVPFYIGDRIAPLAPEPDVVVAPKLGDGRPTQRMGELYSELASAVAAADGLPVVWAGDCLAICGVLAGLQLRGVDPVLLFFDAHGDFHTWDTTQSDFLGGMPLAMVVGRGEQTVVEGAGMRVVPETDAVLIDGRDLDPGEDIALAESAVEQLSIAEVTTWVPPPGRDLYVHVDVDVVDPADLPAVNYPSPGGPSLDETRAALAGLAGHGRTAAVSFSCWNPALPEADRAAAATAHLAAVFD